MRDKSRMSSINTGCIPHDLSVDYGIIPDMIDREEMLRRIDSVQDERKAKGLPASDRYLSKKATGGWDFIRDLRRNPNSRVDASKLLGLAEICDKPPHFFTDEEPQMSRRLGVPHPEWLRLSMKAATEATQGLDVPDLDDLRADLAQRIYAVVVEHADSGEVISEGLVVGLVRAVARQAVASRLRS